MNTSTLSRRIALAAALLGFSGFAFAQPAGQPIRVGLRDRVEDDAMARGAEPDERGTAADRHRPRRAAPHDRAAPVDWRLIGVHLRADGGVDAVGADQQRAAIG